MCIENLREARVPTRSIRRDPHTQEIKQLRVYCRGPGYAEESTRCSGYYTRTYPQTYIWGIEHVCASVCIRAAALCSIRWRQTPLGEKAPKPTFPLTWKSLSLSRARFCGISSVLARATFIRTMPLARDGGGKQKFALEVWRVCLCESRVVVTIINGTKKLYEWKNLSFFIYGAGDNAGILINFFKVHSHFLYKFPRFMRISHTSPRYSVLNRNFKLRGIIFQSKHTTLLHYDSYSWL